MVFFNYFFLEKNDLFYKLLHIYAIILNNLNSIVIVHTLC